VKRYSVIQCSGPLKKLGFYAFFSVFAPMGRAKPNANIRAIFYHFVWQVSKLKASNRHTA